MDCIHIVACSSESLCDPKLSSSPKKVLISSHLLWDIAFFSVSSPFFILPFFSDLRLYTSLHPFLSRLFESKLLKTFSCLRPKLLTLYIRILKELPAYCASHTWTLLNPLLAPWHSCSSSELAVFPSWHTFPLRTLGLIYTFHLGSFPNFFIQYSAPVGLFPTCGPLSLHCQCVMHDRQRNEPVWTSLCCQWPDQYLFYSWLLWNICSNIERNE